MTTVLFVDDQFELRAIHSTYLREHGFQVVTAADGVKALEQARSARPDIILLDHSLPHVTGLDVARELQNDPSTASIPIVMITAHAYGAVGRKARAAGCVSFLAKPCPPSRVLEEVRRFTSPDGAPA
jgi:two-component system, cell cycle response regulator DivK